MLSALREMKLSTRLLLLPAVFVVAFLLFAMVAHSTLSKAKVHGPAYVEVVRQKDLLADSLPPPVYIVETYLTALLISEAPTPRERDRLLKNLEQLRKDFDTRLDYWRNELPAGAVRDQLTESARKPAEEFYAVLDDEFIPAVEAGDLERVRKLREEKLAPLFAQHRSVIDNVVKEATRDAQKTEAEVRDMIDEASSNELLLGGFLIAVLVAISVWLRRAALEGAEREAKSAAELHATSEANAARERAQAEELRSKVQNLLKIVDAAAKGDLTAELAERHDDTIGLLEQAIHELITSMRNNVAAIVQSGQMLGMSAEELSEISEQLTVSAESTSARSQSVSASSDQISATLQTVASGAEEYSASIKEIARSAAEAARVAGTAVSAAHAANSTVAKLGESSAEIGEVIKVITSIAHQTNLLALNATIEAARAGEAGKGFAVVANEVKELAKATSKATKDIGGKIEAIQTDTRQAISVLADINRVISQISDHQHTIATAVEEQTATTNEISRSVSEGARGSREIADSITGVAKAAFDTKEGAAKSSAAAQSLTRMGNELQALVSRFNIGERDGAQGRAQQQVRREPRAAQKSARNGRPSLHAFNGGSNGHLS